MATTTHTLETTWPVDGADVQVEIGFRFTPGYRGDHIDPPAQDECEITKVEIAGPGARRAATAAMVQAIDASVRIYDEMCALAREDRQPDPDAARDAAMDEVRS